MQDLGQYADQHTAIARVFAGDPNPRQGPRIQTPAEDTYIPGGATSRNVHSDDEMIPLSLVGLRR